MRPEASQYSTFATASRPLDGSIASQILASFLVAKVLSGRRERGGWSPFTPFVVCFMWTHTGVC